MAWNQKELLSRLHWNSAGDSGGLASHSLAQQDCWGAGGLVAAQAVSYSVPVAQFPK